MNQVAINLSNRGVTELSQGDYHGAFESLSEAVNIVMQQIQDHVHNDTGSNIFVFRWQDCSSCMSSNDSNHITSGGEEKGEQQQRGPLSFPSAIAGSASFLCLRALRIAVDPSAQDQVEHLCPCGYAWAIWFNLALCSCIIGSRFGEKGKGFFEMAYDLYERVLKRIEIEPFTDSNRHWKMMSMIVSNNQACIFIHFCMHDDAVCCLQKLATTLASCDDMEIEDRGSFCLNLQILGRQTLAAAA